MDALVLSIGATEGDFEVGAVRRLFELGVKPELIAATSVGAINAVKIAEGENRGTTDSPSGLAGLEKVWLSLNSDIDMYVPNPDFDINAVEQAVGAAGVDALQNLIGGVLSAFYGPGILPVIAIFDLAQTAPDVQHLQAAVNTLLNTRSMYLLTPISGKLAANLNPGLVGTSGIHLLLSTVSLEDGVLRFVNEFGGVLEANGVPRLEAAPPGAISRACQPVKDQLDNALQQLRLQPGQVQRDALLATARALQRQLDACVNTQPAPGAVPLVVQLADGAMASASIPLTFPPTKLGSQNYVDGGSRAPVPVAAALPLAAPSAPGLSTAATGGTVAAGTYQVIATYVNKYGETAVSASASITTTGSTSTITVTSPAASGNATGWYAYATQAGLTTFTRQQSSPTAIGANLTLTAPPTSTGAPPPASNTSGPSRVFVVTTFASPVPGPAVNPLTMMPIASFDSENLLSIGARVGAEILPDQINADSIAPAPGWGTTDVVLIQPDIRVHHGLSIDPGLIRIAMANGYMRADDASAARAAAKTGYGPVYQSALDAMTAARLATQIISLRKQIWQREYAANGFVPQEPASPLTPPQPAAGGRDMTALSDVRTLKRNLKLLVDKRVAAGGAVPSGPETLSDWWLDWEHHQFTPAAPLWDQTTAFGLMTAKITSAQPAGPFTDGQTVVFTFSAVDQLEPGPDLHADILLNGIKQPGATGGARITLTLKKQTHTEVVIVDGKPKTITVTTDPVIGITKTGFTPVEIRPAMK